MLHCSAHLGEVFDELIIQCTTAQSLVYKTKLCCFRALGDSIEADCHQAPENIYHKEE